MAYTVLARRYRSSTFDEVVGQSHVAQTLKKAIESDRIAHAYLFCGTRGVGKTSMARILAKALNCEKATGPTAEPCGQCQSCQAVARGEDMDVIEIDAASNTGVDNIREVIENSQYRPARSRFKVYIIDEVHMLSKSAFNALLKTLEEPPSHVKFILATTEPEKVLATILSRCQRYDFRNIPTREIADHLKNLCTQEKIDADDAALLLVAKAGAGSMRDSLSLLDRLLSIGEKNLTIEMIEQLLGMPRSQLIFDLAQAIGQGQVKQVLTSASNMIEGGLSPDTLIASLIDHLRNLLILKTCGIDSSLVEVPGLAIEEMDKQAKQFDAVALTQDITILEELRRQIRQSQAGRALLDATLVRMALAEQFASVADLLAHIDGAPVQKKKPEPQVTPPPAPAARPIYTNPAPPASIPPAPTQPAASVPVVEVKSPPIDANVEPVSSSDLPGVWKQLLHSAAEHGPGLPALLNSGRLISINDEHAVIHYSTANETLAQMLDRNGKKELLRDLFSKVLARNIGVKIEVVAAPPVPIPVPIPAQTSPESAPRRPAAVQNPEPAPATPSVPLTQELKKTLENDPLVRAVIDTLGGSIVKVE